MELLYFTAVKFGNTNTTNTYFFSTIMSKNNLFMACTFFDAFFERLSSATPIKNQSQLANELNVGRAAISLAKQKDTVPSKWILKLAQKYRLNSEWLASGTNPSYPNHNLNKDFKVAPNIHQIHPKLDKHGYKVIDRNNYLNLNVYSIDNDYPETSGELVYLQMQGQSMEPEIKHGDYIIIDQDLTEIYAGYFYALAIDEQITVRRIEKGPEVTVIHCENNKYSTFQIPDRDMDNIKVIGRVINIIRKYV